MGRIRPECPRKGIVLLCRFPVSHPVIADAEGNRREVTIAFLLDEGPCVCFFFRSQRLAVPVGRLRVLPPVQKMSPQVAAGLSPRHVVNQSFQKSLQRGFLISQLGIFKGNKVRKLLLSKIGDVTFDKLRMPFSCVAVDIYGGRLVLLNEGSVTDALRASSAIPTMFRPVQMGEKLLVDGGVLCRVPVKQCKELGADVVVAFDVLANTGVTVEKVPNIISKVLRIYDIMDYNQNEFAKRDFRDCYDLWLAPELDGLSQYEIKDAEKAYELGYAFAKEHVGEIKALIAD